MLTSFIYNCQNQKQPKKRPARQTAVHIYNALLFDDKKEMSCKATKDIEKL